MVDGAIGPYPHPAPPPAIREYDPRAPRVAREVAQIITSRLPDVAIEHIGSSAIPGCEGKGYIDLLLTYGEGRLEAVRDGLADLGFGPQRTGSPFPESRPMRTGTYVYDGTTFLLHVHVVHRGSSEVQTLLAFRDRLRANPSLIGPYVARKREVLAAGVADSGEYSIKKGDFVLRILDEEGFPSSTGDAH